MNRAIVWFRRDLRLDEHPALNFAIRNFTEVIPLFVFDTTILQALIDKKLFNDRRIHFIVARLQELKEIIEANGGKMIFAHGDPIVEVAKIAKILKVNAVICHHDYEPSAIHRDLAVKEKLNSIGISFHTFKDQVIFEREQILNQSGSHYTVFTPYKNAWINKLRQQREQELKEYKNETINWCKDLNLSEINTSIPSWEQLRFNPPTISIEANPDQLWQKWQKNIDNYHETRDYPALALKHGNGTSRLSVHLRFGTISIRKLVRYAMDLMFEGNKGGEIWLSELIWREFYFSLLWHKPYLVNQCFRAECNALAWDYSETAKVNFTLWCEGKTGYPLVDAGMRQLNQTGWMHNRVRMVVASFLTKDLGIDWRWGEGYFAEKLLDYDLAANNGGWQWSASTGCDAQPWFRIFNPITQSEKFDANGEYIRNFCPELSTVNNKFIHAPWNMPLFEQQITGVIIGKDYPKPIVNHASARLKTLERFKLLRD